MPGTGSTGWVSTAMYYQQLIGRALVVHNRAGARIACVSLHAPLDAPMDMITVSSTSRVLGAYPGSSWADAVAVSSVTMQWSTLNNQTTVDLEWTNLVADSACTTVNGSVANSCGIHLHSGTTCLDDRRTTSLVRASTGKSLPSSLGLVVSLSPITVLAPSTLVPEESDLVVR